MLSKIETYRFTVEPFHVDFTGHLFLGVLGNHMLNAAGRHSHNRGWGIDQLNKAQYTWVISRLSIQLDEMPAQYEHVEIETWVERVMRLFTERNFLIRNADDGRIYGYARSVWAMIDIETRQPSDLLAFQDGDIMRYVLSAEEKPCPIPRFGRVRVNIPPDLATSSIHSCSEEQPTANSPLQIRTIPTYYSDVDINGHINSVKYIEHILDLFPLEQYKNHRICRFDIGYKTESYLGDRLTLYCEETDGEHHIEMRKNIGSSEKPEGETVVQAKVVWG